MYCFCRRMLRLKVHVASVLLWSRHKTERLINSFNVMDQMLPRRTTKRRARSRKLKPLTKWKRRKFRLKLNFLMVQVWQMSQALIYPLKKLEMYCSFLSFVQPLERYWLFDLSSVIIPCAVYTLNLCFMLDFSDRLSIWSKGMLSLLWLRFLEVGVTQGGNNIALLYRWWSSWWN